MSDENAKDKSAPQPGDPGGSEPAPPGGTVPGEATPAASPPRTEPKPAAPKPARPPAGPDPTELRLRAEVPSIPLARVRDRFPELAAGAVFFAGVPIVSVPPERIVEVCRFLKEDPESDCRYLSNLHATNHPDRPKPFEVVYHLFSITRHHWIELRVDLGEGEEVPSVTGVWKTANWHEREAFDLVGVRFAGHPDLTRILLPDDWAGHPLRKDYPLEGKEGDHAVYR